MGNFWLKLKVWTKIVLFGAIALYIALFAFKNSDKPTVTVWLFFDQVHEGSIFWFAVMTFLAGGATAMLARTIFSTLRQYRDMQAAKQQAKLKKDLADMQAKAAMLQARPSGTEPKVK